MRDSNKKSQSVETFATQGSSMGEVRVGSADNNNNNNHDKQHRRLVRNNSDDDFHYHDEEDGKKDEPEHDLMARASMAVRGIRLWVYTVFIMGIIGASLAVYYVTRDNEVGVFQEQFRLNAQAIFHSVGQNLEQTLGSVDSLAVTLVSQGREQAGPPITTEQSSTAFPFVYLPDFSARVETLLGLGRAMRYGYYPVVTRDQREAWETQFASVQGPLWLNETTGYMEASGLWGQNNLQNATLLNVISQYELSRDGKSVVGMEEVPQKHPGPFMPMWQTQEPNQFYPYNWDLMFSGYKHAILPSIGALWDTHKVAIASALVTNNPYYLDYELDMNQSTLYPEPPPEAPQDAISEIRYPIIQQMIDEKQPHDAEYDRTEYQLLGAISATVRWGDMLQAILPEEATSRGIRVVFENPCNSLFTYEVNGPHVTFVGEGAHYDAAYQSLQQSALLPNLVAASPYSRYAGIPVNAAHCPYTIHIAPTAGTEHAFLTNRPNLYCATAALVLSFIALVFLVYDYYVEHRQNLVMATADRARAIVTSLFPSNVRTRLYNAQQQRTERRKSMASGGGGKDKNKRVSFLSGSDGGSTNGVERDDSLPIADYFPHVTVLFADLAGFTSWSSSREPPQVFILLETLYGAFDSIARDRGVFKIETIGDCYVACVGLPVPREGHAVVMSRFAADCTEAMNEITKELELTLGPGTADLLLRVGLHSGAVTAGVLRGEKSRYQIFGDTVNTAARMESNGIPDRIHCSKKTADLLLQADKKEWVTKRDDLIEAKGKGKMQTFWVTPRGRSTQQADSLRNAARLRGQKSNMSLQTKANLRRLSKGQGSRTLLMVHRSSEAQMQLQQQIDTKKQRLVDWNASILEGPMCKLYNERVALGQSNNEPLDYTTNWTRDGCITIRDEIVKSLPMRAFSKIANDAADDGMELPDQAVNQLHAFVGEIASKYNDGNPYHNFEHACHVTMWTNKFLRRIIATAKSVAKQSKTPEDVHVQSFGIASDPLVSIVLIFAALISDIEHLAVPNAQLIEDHHVLAAKYNNQSIQEQNSFDVAWNTLMKPEFAELHACLFGSPEELMRFRQMFVNTVMATDVTDVELSKAREERWQQCFSRVTASFIAISSEALANQKATVMLEYLMQSAVVCHTMQPWTVYQKWSRRLFQEMYSSYAAGRLAEDPAAHWYEVELTFFDDHVIPLARKLTSVDMFGGTGDEFLDCAIENRREFEAKGRMLVQEMKEQCILEQNAAKK